MKGAPLTPCMVCRSVSGICWICVARPGDLVRRFLRMRLPPSRTMYWCSCCVMRALLYSQNQDARIWRQGPDGWSGLCCYAQPVESSGGSPPVLNLVPCFTPVRSPESNGVFHAPNVRYHLGPAAAIRQVQGVQQQPPAFGLAHALAT